MWKPPIHEYRNPLPDTLGYWWLENRIVSVTRIHQRANGTRTVEYYDIGDECGNCATDTDTDWERVIPRSHPAQSDVPPTPQ